MLIIETSGKFQPEKEYCFHVLLTELLGVQYRIVFSAEKNYRLRLPNGADIVIEDHFFAEYDESRAGYLSAANCPSSASVLPHPFLPGEQLACIYGSAHFSIENQHITCGLDVFASAFFMLTRWEEYALPHRDEHGRFPAEMSLACKAGFLDRPVVNEYAEFLRHMFATLGWELPRSHRQFTTTITCDVDHPLLWWSHAARLKTLAGSVYKRGNLKEARFWFHLLLQKRDPYDVFDEWLELFEKNSLTGHFNFLGKRPPWSNCWYPLEHPFVTDLIGKIVQRGHIVGFHPSYEAFDRPDLFEKELASLRAVAQAPVTTGRQHYLRFATPQTWQVWEDAGMTWDSTLGYPEAEGFRCGICNEFPVFNFLTRKMLKLREKPLIAMDVTLALYRKYTPETAVSRLQHLRRQVERYNGEFVLLWHNSSWNTYFWAEWREVFFKGLGAV